MIVQKYGGSSLSSIQKIKQIAKNIKNTFHEKLVIVVSAMGKTTNKLISKAEKICSFPSKRELDSLLSTGEQTSASLMAIALNKLGIKAISQNAFQLKIKTTNNHTKALIKEINTKKIYRLFQKFDVIVVAGFQGISDQNSITTLGRGGSDTTAVAIASALHAKCQIFTDVEAIYSVNPSLFNDAKKLSTLTFKQALEMASSGAKVLDERALEIATKFNTTIYLGKSLENNFKKGTYVMNKNYIETPKVQALSVRENITLFNIKTKNISQIVSALKSLNQNLEMFSIINENISFICKKTDEKMLDKTLKQIQNTEFEKISNFSRLTLVGFGFATHPQILMKLSKILRENNVDFSHLIMTETTLSFLINPQKEKEAIKLIAEEFDLW